MWRLFPFSGKMAEREGNRVEVTIHPLPPPQQQQQHNDDDQNSLYHHLYSSPDPLHPSCTSSPPFNDKSRAKLTPLPLTLMTPDYSPPPAANALLPQWKRVLYRIDPIIVMLVKWALIALIVLFCSAVVFGVFYSGLTYKKKGSSSSSEVVINGITCESPFGSILGVAYGNVFGYSNCNDTFVSTEYAYIPVPLSSLSATTTATTTNMRSGNKSHGSSPMKKEEGEKVEKLFTGLKWQCVEFARRFWILQGSNGGSSSAATSLSPDHLQVVSSSLTPQSSPPAIFGSVDGAADIWFLLDSVTLVENRTRVIPLKKYPNGLSVLQGGTMPREKDLLIYARREGDFPYGHVAVIVEVVMGFPWVLSSSSSMMRRRRMEAGVAAGNSSFQHNNINTGDGDGGNASCVRKEATPQALRDDGEGTAQRIGVVRVAEQNWLSTIWTASVYHNYTREISLSYDHRHSSYILEDPEGIVLGWVRY